MAHVIDTSWDWLLELKLRRITGNAFQTFFGDVMEARHGSEFVRTKPYGSLGDSGCDGYLSTCGSVYACYGAQNGAAPNVGSFVQKINDDFAKAQSKLSDVMKCWYVTHNLIEGVPTEAIQTIEALKKANPDIVFGFFAPPSFRQLFSEFDEDMRSNFLGPSARNKDYQQLHMEEV